MAYRAHFRERRRTTDTSRDAPRGFESPERSETRGMAGTPVRRSRRLSGDVPAGTDEEDEIAKLQAERAAAAKVGPSKAKKDERAAPERELVDAQPADEAPARCAPELIWSSILADPASIPSRQPPSARARAFPPLQNPSSSQPRVRHADPFPPNTSCSIA